MRSLASPDDRAELLRRLKAVKPDSGARWGRMSAHQMVCHVADSFRMAMGDKAVSLDTNPFKQTILKWVVLYLPIRWPPGILTSPELDQSLGGTQPANFATDVAQLERLLEIMPARTADLAIRLHPYFGRLSPAAWLRWGYLHTDHHLRQFGV